MLVFKLILTTLLRLGVQGVFALKLEQKELLFVEEHLFHDSVAFQRFDNVHYVEALQQEVLALLHEELFPLRLAATLAQLVMAAAPEAAEALRENVESCVDKLHLVDDQVENRGKLLSCWLLPI